MGGPLHKKTGDILKNLEKNLKIDVVLDKACGIGKTGKSQNIPLFLKKEEIKSNETEICDVDAMVIKNNEIKIIIEIEESGFLPTKIYGKYMASNLAEYYAHDTLENEILEIKKSNVLFIQIIDTKGLESISSKPEQFKNIEKSINNLIKTVKDAGISLGCIKEYKLLQIDGNKIESNPLLFNEFENIIKDAIE
ncbi:MAG: hypothetical protein LBB80_01430 [Treponema sp.]|jgi:hypothetical protein|nr:hypothetical protein [Treponema sp.]